MHILEAALAANAPRYSFSPTAKDTTPMEPPHGGWRVAGAVLAGMLLLLVTGRGHRLSQERAPPGNVFSFPFLRLCVRPAAGNGSSWNSGSTHLRK
jgi:hypothetical protein